MTIQALLVFSEKVVDDQYDNSSRNGTSSRMTPDRSWDLSRLPSLLDRSDITQAGPQVGCADSRVHARMGIIGQEIDI